MESITLVVFKLKIIPSNYFYWYSKVQDYLDNQNKIRLRYSLIPFIKIRLRYSLIPFIRSKNIQNYFIEYYFPFDLPIRLTA